MFRQNPFEWWVRAARVFLFILLPLLGIALPALAQADGQIEPDAGTWMTWVLDSGSEIPVAAPPDEAATQAEIAELAALVAERDEAGLQQIEYWNGGPPSMRWNQIGIREMVDRGLGHPVNRTIALLNAAIYDATVAAWNSKYTYNRARPSEVDPSLETVIPNPASPSYPSEHAVTAGAAAAMLSWMFPEEAEAYQALAAEAVHSRLLAGVEYPSDVEAGLALGQAVAERVIAWAEADGSDAQWTGSAPTGPGYWTGENPTLPLAGTWQTYALTSGDQFRPAPPPAWDSEEMAAEMQELRDFERTPASNALATFWNFGSGGTRNFWHYNLLANRMILEGSLRDNAPRAAQVYALANIALYDSFVSCWDAKYAYWSMRPFQIDPEFSPLFTTPPFPSYPSGHSCTSTAMAEVLAELFPAHAEEVRELAEQAGDSRIWAGIHFRSDIEAGEEIGRDVAGAVLSAGGIAQDD